MAALLALGGAACWGVGDFLGGLAARRMAVIAVLAISQAIGLAALYRGLAVGAMGIVAPISAASPVVGLTADAVQGTFPAALQWLGIALVLAGIAALSLESSGDGGGRVAS